VSVRNGFAASIAAKLAKPLVIIGDLVDAYCQEWMQPDADLDEFSRVLLKVVVEGSSPSSSGDRDTHLRELTAEEWRYCRSAWNEAGLRPVEKSRRRDAKKYEQALEDALYRGPGIDLDPTNIVIEYETADRRLDARLVRRHCRDAIERILNNKSVPMYNDRLEPTNNFTTQARVCREEFFMRAPTVWSGYGGPRSFDNSDFRLDPLTFSTARTTVLSHRDIDTVGYVLEDGSKPPLSARQRRAMRYQACLDEGLDMSDALRGRMPSGIGKVAERFGISRSAFTADVIKHLEFLAAQKDVGSRGRDPLTGWSPD
jgi:hypothetical protein